MLLARRASDRGQRPDPDDELFAAELGRLDRKIRATTAERRRLADLYQAALIDLAELKRRSSKSPPGCATSRPDVTPSPPSAPRSPAGTYSTTTYKSPAGTSRSGCGYPSTRPTPARATSSRRAQRHCQPGPQLCQAKTVCVPLVATDGDSYRMRQARARGGKTP
jgi:hypothetical protein